MKLSAILKQAREKAGFTQGELAKKTKIDSANISSFERGLSVPTDAQIKLLAKALNISANSLLEAKRAENSKTVSKPVKASTIKAPVKSTGAKTSTTKAVSKAKAPAKSSDITEAELNIIALYRKADTKTKSAVKELLSKGKTTAMDNPIGDAMQNILGDVIGSLLKK